MKIIKMKEIFFSFLLGYLFGSFPSAYIISKKIKNIDIRKVGDRNPGARNVYKNVGKLAGTLTFLIDFSKGFLPIFVFYRIFKKENLALISGIGSILGHDFPIFLKFYGGKSISTILGILFSLFPFEFIFSIFIFLIFFLLKKHFDQAIALFFVSFVLILIFEKVDKILIFYVLFIVASIGIKKIIDFPRERLRGKLINS